MFVISEPRLPTRRSLSLVEHHAASVLDRVSHPPDLERYLYGHKLRLAFDVDYALHYLPANCSILEVGAAPYFLTLPLLQLGFRVSPLDNAQAIDGVVADFPNATPMRCDLDRDTIPMVDNTFDAVIVNEVVEHLRIDLIHSVSELYRILKPGGILLMSTPNLRSFIGIYNLVFKGEAWAVSGGIYGQFATLRCGYMGHIREYTANEMQKFFSRIGFNIDGVIYRSNYSRRHPWYYLSKLMPQFRPYFSIVCSKPVTVDAQGTRTEEQAALKAGAQA